MLQAYNCVRIAAKRNIGVKYDTQLTELKRLLPTAKNILIALPANLDVDRLAAGLSLFLSLEEQGKQVVIVSQDTLRVSQAHLFGIDHIQNTIPQTGGGNLTLVMEGVAASDGTVPALQKLDWFAENNNLNLVFHVLPGQSFQPSRIIQKYQGSGFDLILVIGALNLNSLGNVYTQNSQVFSGVHIVNIDNQVANTGFGQTNVVDTASSSVSEIMASILTDLGLPFDADPASNLLAGVFEATNNLSGEKVNADTYMVVAQCLRVGGRRPQPAPQQAGQSLDLSSFAPKPAPNVPFPQPVQPQPQPYQQPEIEPYTTPTVAASENQPSPEERPAGEGVVSETVEPEWLTPKIFKGSSLG